MRATTMKFGSATNNHTMASLNCKSVSYSSLMRGSLLGETPAKPTNGKSPNHLEHYGYMETDGDTL